MGESDKSHYPLISNGNYGGRYRHFFGARYRKTGAGINRGLRICPGGKLNRDVQIQSHDEIGLLINVFNKLIRDMRLLAEQAMIISRGDLTVHIETKGDLACAFTNMLESLRTLIKQTQESVTRLSSVSTEMLSSMEEQASGSAELAASVGR